MDAENNTDKDNLPEDSSLKNDLDELNKKIKKNIEKNNEDQTKQVVTISWAATVFMFSICIEKVLQLSIYGKGIAIIASVSFSLSLLSEYLVCMLAIKSLEEYEQLVENHVGDINKANNLHNKSILMKKIRDYSFIVAMITLTITIPFIIIENNEQTKQTSSNTQCAENNSANEYSTSNSKSEK